MAQHTLGVDSGTQSTKVVVCSADGTVVAAASAPHPDGCVQHPSAWWSALVSACQRLPPEVRDDVAAIAVAGQQHGCVALDGRRDVLGPAALWCDTAAAPEAARLNQLAGFASEVGSRLVASFTIAKLADVPAGTAAVCLPHDWLTFQLTGNLVTDRGDASGTGWWDPRTGIRRDLLQLANHAELAVPEPLGPDEAAGELQTAPAVALGLRPGIPLACGTGDNMAAALGIGAREGEVVVSLGTSGTVFAVSARWTQDQSGAVAGFADATDRYLPLVCTLNCTTPVERVARWLGLSLEAALDRADRPTDLTFLPYLKGERTPDLPAASGAILGFTERTEPDDLLAAATQGAAVGLAWGAAALEAAGVPAAEAVVVVGGGARHRTWLGVIADAFNRPAASVDGQEHAARGMAAQARAVLTGVAVADVADAWRPSRSAPARPRPGRVQAGRHAELLGALSPLWHGPASRG